MLGSIRCNILDVTGIISDVVNCTCTVSISVLVVKGVTLPNMGLGCMCLYIGGLMY